MTNLSCAMRQSAPHSTSTGCWRRAVRIICVSFSGYGPRRWSASPARLIDTFRTVSPSALHLPRWLLFWKPETPWQRNPYWPYHRQSSRIKSPRHACHLMATAKRIWHPDLLMDPTAFRNACGGPRTTAGSSPQIHCHQLTLTCLAGPHDRPSLVRRHSLSGCIHP